ncbi:MAG TPA: hypothetical protein VKY74_20260, partial [Chloroflexia bacterium]|nr:hypothetical protein [Chloroflexia bacterium]
MSRRARRGGGWGLGACLVAGLLAGAAPAGRAAPWAIPGGQACEPEWNLSIKAAAGIALSAVAAAGPDNIWAVGEYQIDSGQYQTFAEHWTGTRWTIVPSPNVNPPEFPLENRLDGVAAIGPGDTWAVGSHKTITTTAQTVRVAGQQPLIEHWDGQTWSVVPSPSRSPEWDHHLIGVAGTGPGDVWAVGAVADGALSAPLVFHWDGGAWRDTPAPRPPGPNAELLGVTARGPDDAW